MTLPIGDAIMANLLMYRNKEDHKIDYLDALALAACERLGWAPKWEDIDWSELMDDFLSIVEAGIDAFEASMSKPSAEDMADAERTRAELDELVRGKGMPSFHKEGCR